MPPTGSNAQGRDYLSLVFGSVNCLNPLRSTLNAQYRVPQHSILNAYDSALLQQRLQRRRHRTRQRLQRRPKRPQLEP